MNSWKSTSLSACTPPFSTFMNGTGTTWADAPPRYRNSDRPSESAAARASAIEAHLALEGGIPPGIEDFTCKDELDRCHGEGLQMVVGSRGTETGSREHIIGAAFI